VLEKINDEEKNRARANLYNRDKVERDFYLKYKFLCKCAPLPGPGPFKRLFFEYLNFRWLCLSLPSFWAKPVFPRRPQVLLQSTLPTAETMHSVANVTEVEELRSARGQVESFEIIWFQATLWLSEIVGR